MKEKTLNIAMAVPLVFVALFFCCFALFILTGGGMDYEIKLPNHYSIARISSDCHMLVKPDDTVVAGPTVDRYRVMDKFVMGYVSRERNYGDAALGYFVVDTKTGKVDDGLLKSEWLSALHKHGIDHEPRLKSPNRFHALGNLFKE